MKNDQKGNLLEVLKSVIEVKNMDDETVIGALKSSLRSAAKKYLQLDKRIDVDIDTETDEVRVFLRVEVVDDFPDYDPNMTAEEVQLFDEGFMLVDEAREFNEDAQPGDFLEMEVPISAFGRQAIQNAKQLLTQSMRDAERQKIQRQYASRIGTMISGEIFRIEGANLIVNLGSTEAVIPPREQIRKEKWRQGDSIKAVITKIDENAKIGTPLVVLSRVANSFLRELFRQEVPEIYDGSVEIKAIVRDPGFRAKVAVSARDERIDPVGACVGMKGARVQAIVRELSNERIDIVVWSEDIETYVRRALAPANIVKFVPVKGTKRIVVIIADEDLAQAIGRGGQNIRLASTLVERNLDVFGEKEWSDKSDEEKAKVLMPKAREIVRETVREDLFEAEPEVEDEPEPGQPEPEVEAVPLEVTLEPEAAAPEEVAQETAVEEPEAPAEEPAEGEPAAE